MTDLRKAAEMGLEALEANLGKWAAKTPAIQALRQALAQPEQEPKIKHSLSFCKSIQSRVYVGDEMVSLAKMTLEEAGLMPKREWVGLTVEEVLELLPSSEWKADVTLIFAKAIEAKLKEKNT